MTCAACGHSCAPSSRFCSECGAALAGASPASANGNAPPAEGASDPDRRHVTIVFADVSDFTAISERLDPEEVRAFQIALFAALSEVVARFGGFVEKYVGDAILAIFGAPIAHEDDPQRALAAALEMMAAAARLSEAWASRLDRPVALHIGVNTGPVVAGRLGAGEAAAYAVTGDAVNTTARLLAAAAGSILVSETTFALTRHRFAFAPPAEMPLRGKAAPLVTYRLEGALAEPRAGRGLAELGLSTPLLGRAAELAELTGVFDRAVRGRAQLVEIVAEAGSGKSRLIDELLSGLAASGRLDGAVVRRTACPSLGATTYGTFGALFREAYRVGATDTLAVTRGKLAAGLGALGAGPEVAQAVEPVLNYLVGRDDARLADVEPEQIKRQILLAGRLLIEQRLEKGPLLLIVDDLHWGDSASTELLRDVVDALADRRLMMVLAYRPDAEPVPARRAAQTVLRLAPLSEDDTRSLVATLLGEVEGAERSALEAFVAARSGGNPFFAEELIRNLASRGALVREEGRWRYRGSEKVEHVPATLHGLLLSRVDGLPSEARRLLQEAAVLGAAFDEADLAAVASSPGSVGQILDRLVAADMLREAGAVREGRGYRFTHALVHEVVYENLLIARRAELHGTAGRALEARVGERPERIEDLAALARHFSLSSDKTKGARYFVAAGDFARSVYANEDALRHFERAAATLAGRGDAGDLALAVRERIADLLALTERKSEALAHYDAVLHGLEHDRAAAARLCRKIGGVHWDAGDRDRARACFAQGLERLGEADHALERAQLWQEIGRLAFRAGDSAEAIVLAERALAGAGTEGEGDAERAREAAATRVQALNTLGVALARLGRLDEAIERIERSIELADRGGLLQAACRGYTNLGVLYSAVDPRRSIETCERGLEVARKVGDLGFQSRLYANLAVSYCALTDRCEDEGIAAARRAIDLDRHLGLIDHLAVPLIVLGQICQCRGEHAKALGYYEEALGLAEEAGEPQLLFPCYDGLATLHLDTGDLPRAETYLSKSREVCERAGVEPDALMVLPFLC